MRKILAQTYALRQGAFGHVVVQELADDLVTHSHPQTQFSFWLGGGRCEAHLGNVLVEYGEHVALHHCVAALHHDAGGRCDQDAGGGAAGLGVSECTG